MKSFSAPAMAEIVAGTAIVTGAVDIACDPPVRLWGGWGVLPLGGHDFEPIGDAGVVKTSAAMLGGGDQPATLTLSGVDPAAIELIDAEALRGASVILYRLIFAGDGRTLLDAQIFDRGRLDDFRIENVVGGPASLIATVETASRGLGRKGGRMRSDADQRLVNPADGYFKNVSYAAEKKLYWGGKKPAVAGQALGGASGGGLAASAGAARFMDKV